MRVHDGFIEVHRMSEKGDRRRRLAEELDRLAATYPEHSVERRTIEVRAHRMRGLARVADKTSSEKGDRRRQLAAEIRRLAASYPKDSVDQRILETRAQVMARYADKQESKQAPSTS
jgi:hypothetical protein